MSEAATKPMKKSAARLGAVQALYQMDLAQTPVNDVLAEFESHWLGQEVEGTQLPDADVKLFRAVVEAALSDQRRIDQMLDAALTQGWPLKRVEAVLRAVLRAGLAELLSRPDVPARVVIAEYVNVAGAFLERDETGMVNAVLDSLARDLRPGEFDRPPGA
ncbi:transcription antitermination factor NusB [Xanthobacter tagetidis]|jgi:N utilization substance protein B|uniref:Transcription antitermination protein NusB n=1 Tax=Xanthobacter tagetidis TaxID=60216 RepID=A0A3L7A9S8_9HYPH|nr:transcription antitermination factor NusB [Xanthobacter tagetidis]MBB6309616.1 N utilization substance protein B [Xanthobacter tagetidis]RLP77166.1 transcription antitermination factor NusB [Xanthobacter tagetidis]